MTEIPEVEAYNNIYTLVPQEKIKPITQEHKNKIVNLLRGNKGIFFKARSIAEKSGLPTKQTQVEVRKAITELIEEQHIPIVSTSKGFAYAKNPNMILHYIEALEHRQKGLQRRINSLRKIYKEMLGKNGQTTFTKNL